MPGVGKRITLLIPKEKLAELIVTMSQKKIAKMFGCGQITICRLLREYNILSPRVANYKSIEEKGIEQKICAVCSKVFYSKKGRKYCSCKCFGELRAKDKLQDWLDNKIAGYRNKRAAKWIKDYLFKTRGEKCELCGWSKHNPYSGRSALEIDHIDGNWKNNRPENLRIICPNCHALTENFRGLNRGHGRFVSERV